MSKKCPSCGFESPEGSQWCDFCKEPFRRKEPKAPEPQAPAPAAGPKLRYSVPPTVGAQERAKAPAPSDKPQADELPPEAHQRLTAALTAEETEKVPSTPKWVRWAAWAFLGVWFVAGAILAGVMLGRQKVQQSKAAAPSLPAPAPASVPAPDPE